MLNLIVDAKLCGMKSNELKINLYSHNIMDKT